jgi:hypothetical protein
MNLEKSPSTLDKLMIRMIPSSMVASVDLMDVDRKDSHPDKFGGPFLAYGYAYAFTLLRMRSDMQFRDERRQRLRGIADIQYKLAGFDAQGIPMLAPIN